MLLRERERVLRCAVLLAPRARRPAAAGAWARTQAWVRVRVRVRANPSVAWPLLGLTKPAG